MNTQIIIKKSVLGPIISVFVLILIVSILAGLTFLFTAELKSTVAVDGSGTATETNTFLLKNGTNGTLSSQANSIDSVTANNDTWLRFNVEPSGFGGASGSRTEGVNITRLFNSSIFCERADGCGFSVSYWINQTQYALNLDTYHISNVDYNNNWGWSIGTTGAGTLEWQLRNQTFSGDHQDNNATSGRATLAVGGLSLNVWHHIVIVYNGTVATMYMNGTLVTSNSTTIKGGLNNHNVTTIRGLYLMTPQVPTLVQNRLNGSMEELRIYNTTLTSAQVTEIYNSKRTPNASLPSTNLMVWYSFDEGSGETVIDKSSFSNNGTMFNQNDSSYTNMPFYINDGVTNTLTSPTMYLFNTTSNQIQLRNIRYEWSPLTVSSTINSSGGGGGAFQSQTAYNAINDTEAAGATVVDYLALIFLAIIFGAVLTLVLKIILPYINLGKSVNGF